MSEILVQPPFAGSVPHNGSASLDERVRDYWNRNVHDVDVSGSEPGSERFFRELEEYRRAKLAYLWRILDVADYAGHDVLEIGCGLGLDLVRFAKAGARAIGLDVSERAIALATRRFELAGQQPRLLVADGATLPFASGSFDFIYSHGVLPYVADPVAVVGEAYRVLRKGGAALFMTYHRRSWLNLLRHVGRIELAHADAPVLRVESQSGFEAVLEAFDAWTVIAERFPVATRMQGGWKATLFNQLVVPAWRVVPETVVRPFGWHLLAFCRKNA